MFVLYFFQLFAVLRERVFSLTHEVYVDMLTRELPLRLESGKKLAEFCSADGQLSVRELKGEQVEQLHAFLRHYHPYVVQRQAKTLLPQLLGLYRVTLDGGEHK